MTDDFSNADWPTLIRELPIAVQQLGTRDAHCSYEVAVLLRAALELLNVPAEPEQAYEILIDAIGRIASLSDRHRDQLSAPALEFLDRVDDAAANHLAETS